MKYSMPNENSLEGVKKVTAKSSRINWHDLDLLVTIRSDIRLQPIIDYANIKHPRSCSYTATVMCGTIKVIYKVTGW